MLAIKTIVRLSFIILFSCAAANAETIANCSNPKGKSYFVNHGIVGKTKSGWEDDKITGGMFSLVKLAPKGYDISFVDIRKQITSSVADGARVILTSNSPSDAIFVVAYPETGTTEIYKFFREDSGDLMFSVSSVRSNNAPVTKISMMIGDCSSIDFEKIK